MLTNLINTKQNEIISQYINNIKENVDTIIVWGCSTASRYIDFLKRYQLEQKVKFLADNNIKLQGTTINKLKILSPEEVVKLVGNSSNILIVISSIHCFDIKNQLLNLNISEKILMF